MFLHNDDINGALIIISIGIIYMIIPIQYILEKYFKIEEIPEELSYE